MTQVAARLWVATAYVLAPCVLAVGAAVIRSLDRCRVLPEDGMRLISPTVEWLLAAIAGASGDAAAAEPLLAWAPPVVAASTVIACYGITLHYFDPRVALLASALVCILPANVLFSQLGCVDHHYAVAFVTLLLLGAGAALLGQAQDTSRPTSACIGRAGFVGVAMAVSLLIWPGTMPLVAMVQLAYGVRVLSAPGRESAIGWARTMALAHGVGALALALWPSGIPSGAHVVWLAMCGAGYGLLAELWSRGAGAASARGRALALLAFALIALGVVLVSASQSECPAGWEWLWQDAGARAEFVDAPRADVLFTRFVYVAPLALALVLWDRRTELTASLWLLTAWGVFTGLASLVGGRLTSTASVAYALLLAAALDAAFRHAVWRDGWGWPTRFGAAVVYVAVVAWALWPSVAMYAVEPTSS